MIFPKLLFEHKINVHVKNALHINKVQKYIVLFNSLLTGRKITKS